MTTLRQRIRQDMINCLPWKHYRGEIQALPISAQCLFSKKGLPWDILEIQLKSEGWLFENEELWEVLLNLKRLMSNFNYEEDFGPIDPFDSTWTEEDFIHFYNNL